MSQKASNGKVAGKSRRVLPSDRIAFEKQLEILRAWAAASGPSLKPVQNAEVAAIIKMAASTISLANPFFTDVGFLLRGEGGLIPSADVMGFNHAHQWNPETAALRLGPIVDASWFSQALLPRLSFGPLSVADAIAALSEGAGASREYEDQLHTLLEYMEVAGSVVIDNGMVRACQNRQPVPTTAAATTTTTTTTAAPSHSDQREPVVARATPAISTAFSKPTEGMVNFHVSFRVDMLEMSGWSADRISAFFNGIAQVLNAKGSIEETGASA